MYWNIQLTFVWDALFLYFSAWVGAWRLSTLQNISSVCSYSPFPSSSYLAVVFLFLLVVPVPTGYETKVTKLSFCSKWEILNTQGSAYNEFGYNGHKFTGNNVKSSVTMNILLQRAVSFIYFTRDPMCTVGLENMESMFLGGT